MLSPDEQMKIISQATAEGYQGSFTELLQQAEQPQSESQEIPPEQQQSPPPIPPNTSLTSGANLQSTSDSTGGGLVQSYADTSPSIGNFDTGDGVRDVLYDPDTYESGGFKDTVQSVLNKGIYKLSDFSNYDLDDESNTSSLTEDQMRLRLLPDKKREGGFKGEDDIKQYEVPKDLEGKVNTGADGKINVNPRVYRAINDITNVINPDDSEEWANSMSYTSRHLIPHEWQTDFARKRANMKGETKSASELLTQTQDDAEDSNTTKSIKDRGIRSVLKGAEKLTDEEFENFNSELQSIAKGFQGVESLGGAMKSFYNTDLSGIKEYREKMGLSRADILKLIQPSSTANILERGKIAALKSGLKLKKWQQGGVRKYEHGGAHDDINLETGSTINAANSLQPGITGSLFTSPLQKTHNYGLKIGMNDQEFKDNFMSPEYIQEMNRNAQVDKNIDKASFGEVYKYNRKQNLRYPNTGNETFDWRGGTYGTESETEQTQRLGAAPLNTKPESVANWEAQQLLNAKNNPEDVILGDTEDATIEYGSKAQRYGSTHPESNAKFNRDLQIQAGNMTTNEAEISAARYQYNTGIGGMLNKEQQNLLMMDDRNQWELEQKKVAQKSIDEINSPINASTTNSIAIAQSGFRFDDQSINTEGYEADLFTHAAESTGMQFSNASQTASIKDPTRAEWDKIQFILNDPDLSEDAKAQYARSLPNSSTGDGAMSGTLGFNYMTTPLAGGQTKNGTYEDFVELKGQIKAGKQITKNAGMIYPTIDNKKMQMMTFGNMWANMTPGGAQHKYDQLKDVYKNQGQAAMYDFADNTSYMANQGLVGDAVLGAGAGGVINKSLKYAKPLSTMFKPGVNVGRLNTLFNPIQKAKYVRNAAGQFQSSKNLSVFNPQRYQFNTGQGFKNMVTGRNIQTGMKLAPIESRLPGWLGQGVNTLRNTRFAKGLQPVTQGLGVATDLFHLAYTPYFAKSVFEGGQDIYKGDYHKGTEKIVTNATEFFNPVSKPLQYSLEGYKIGRDAYSGHDASAIARFFGGAKYRSASQFPKAVATTFRKGDKFTGFGGDTDYINQQLGLQDYSILNSIYDPLYKRKGGFRLK